MASEARAPLRLELLDGVLIAWELAAYNALTQQLANTPVAKPRAVHHLPSLVGALVCDPPQPPPAAPKLEVGQRDVHMFRPGTRGEAVGPAPQGGAEGARTALAFSACNQF